MIALHGSRVTYTKAEKDGLGYYWVAWPLTSKLITLQRLYICTGHNDPVGSLLCLN